jgi:hypothetical protein
MQVKIGRKRKGTKGDVVAVESGMQKKPSGSEASAAVQVERANTRVHASPDQPSQCTGRYSVGTEAVDQSYRDWRVVNQPIRLVSAA